MIATHEADAAPETIQEAYKAMRKALAMSEPKLAEKLGVSRSTIQRRENGKGEIQPEAMFALQFLAHCDWIKANTENAKPMSLQAACELVLSSPLAQWALMVMSSRGLIHDLEDASQSAPTERPAASGA